ncbi:MAG: ABC transporter permease [Micromonosporaceae bacterium]|jgi:NitT/TauT family transport system permease protein|nr:ABC transporter permease [Micromonosporaceae bacterium]
MTVKKRGQLPWPYAIGVPVAGLSAAIGLWWLIVVAFHIDPIFLPSPRQVVQAFGQQRSLLLTETWSTLWMTLVGFVIAGAAGLLVAMILTMSWIIERAVLPMIIAFNAVPKVAFVPLLIVWLSFGARPKIAMVALIAFFPVVVATMAGLTSTPAELRELAQSLSASRWQTYLKVRVPWALSQVFVGLKLSITLSLIGVVVAEIQIPDSGLGSVILHSGQTADTALAFAAIALLSVLGVGLFYLMVAVERLLLPWARELSA